MRKQESHGQPLEQDDALFEALGKSKKKKKRKVWITVLIVIAVIAAALAVGVKLLQRNVQNMIASSSAQVVSGTVTRGSIRSAVTGSGTLTDEDLQSVTVPDGVELLEVPLSENDAVAEGDILATVDMASVQRALADVQSQIASLDEQIADAKDDAVDAAVRAGVAGRIKAVYAAEGDTVADTMYRSGALALLSLDGYLAVDIGTDALAAGDGVEVTLADGSAVSGTVERVSAGVATVLIGDDGPECGGTAAVCDADGKTLGSGELYVHSPLRVTGYIGTVESVHVSENERVLASTRLFTLTDTESTANLQTLLRSRAEQEETLRELLRIQHDGAVRATVSGSVQRVDYTDGGTAVATVSPDEKMSVTVSVDETDILLLEVGQTAEVTVSAVGEETYSGIVTQIDKSAQSGGYFAVITLDKQAGMLSGMTARVSVQMNGAEDVLLIPAAALHRTGSGGYVYTSYDEQTEEFGGRVEVVIGLENDDYVEIRSGLSEGDTVYYTEKSVWEEFFGAMGGAMQGSGNGNMPSFGGGQMPDSGGARGGFSGS